jgi:hypothetical protein
MTDRELEQTFPSIEWRKPIRVERTDGLTRYACRFCIARRGLKARELESEFTSEEAVLAHVAAEHA